MTRPWLLSHYSCLRMRVCVEMSRPGPDVSAWPQSALVSPGFVSSLPQCRAASPPQWLSNTMASSARPGNFHSEIMSQQQICLTFLPLVNNGFCVKIASDSAIRGNIARSSEEPWRGGREDSCNWRASHYHATVTVKGCFWKAPWIISVSDLFKSILLELLCVICDLIVTKKNSRCVRRYGWCHRQQYQLYPQYHHPYRHAALFVIFGEWAILVTLFPEAVVIGFSIIIIDTSISVLWWRTGTKVIWLSVHHPVERDYCKSLVTFSDKDN